MNALRSGETLEEEKDTYDISKDLLAHAKSIKSFNASARGKEDEVSVEELKELRRVQKERTEVSLLVIRPSSLIQRPFPPPPPHAHSPPQIQKMKALGMDIRPSMGVRMESRQVADEDDY